MDFGDHRFSNAQSRTNWKQFSAILTQNQQIIQAEFGLGALSPPKHD
jgi:hypothetical protein